MTPAEYAEFKVLILGTHGLEQSKRFHELSKKFDSLTPAERDALRPPQPAVPQTTGGGPVVPPKPTTGSVVPPTQVPPGGGPVVPPPPKGQGGVAWANGGQIQQVFVTNWPNGYGGGGGAGAGGKTKRNGGGSGDEGISNEQGMASMLDQLGPGLGKNAYKGARAMRYIDTIKKADFGKLTGDLGKAFGGAGKAAAGAGATGAGAGAAGAASGAAAGAAGAAGGTAAASGAAGAAAAGGQLAAAAGPIGAVVALADMAAGEIAGKFNKFGRNIERAGDVAVKIAGNDGMGAVASAAESVAGGLEEIPIVGQVWAAEIRLATTALTTFNKVLGAFATRGKELSGYAGGVSQATAMAEVRGQLHDIKEAQSLDSDYKSIIQSQSRIQTNIQDALTPIKMLLMRLLEPMAMNLELATKWLALSADGAMILSQQKDEADRKIFEAVKSIPAIAKLFEKIYEIAKQLDKENLGGMPIDKILALAGQIQLPNQPVDPAAGAATTAIGFPLLK